MIFTIGYDGKGFTTAHLANILDTIGNCVLVDVRLSPKSRIKGWGTNQLKDAIGADRYISRKDLGGGAVTEEAIDWLADNYYQGAAPHCVLLCKEENPGACHRHHEICAGKDLSTHIFPDAMHIFRDDFVSAENLDKIIENDEAEDVELIPVAELRQFVEHCEAN